MVYFIGAGPGDPELITVKAKNILQKAEIVLYTGSLVPKDVINLAYNAKVIKNSHKMSYEEIFDFFLKYKNSLIARVHTGDPSIYSTIAKQIEFLKKHNIDFKIIPGVSAAFGAASSLEIEYTIPGVSQTLILTRFPGNTPQPEDINNILRCKHSSLVFYLSINLIDQLVKKALENGYKEDTPCWVIKKATWKKEEEIIKSDLKNISQKVSHIKGIALILLGEFLYQKEKFQSNLYG